MKSRITIEIDYENGNQPVIQILRKKSDDVRDGLIQSFIQALGDSSNFCIIECVQSHYPNHVFDDDAFQRYHIRPVHYSQLEELKGSIDNLLNPQKPTN